MRQLARLAVVARVAVAARLAAVGAPLAIAALLAGAVPGVAAATPGLPGPPPGAGSGFPGAPRPGVTPAPQPVGPAARIPASVSTPGLLTGTVVATRAVQIPIACHRAGRATLSAAALGRGVLARVAYGCSRGRGVVRAQLTAAQARRLRALGQTLVSIVLADARGSARASVELQSRPRAPRFWSDGGLVCTLLGDNQPYLVDPNFRVSPAVTIDVRPWIAWYTPTGGWQWLGTRGARSSAWYRFTAGPDGVVQWRTPRGAVNPWTWAPIGVSPGHGISLIGVFEVIYWYRHPLYRWAYSRSSAMSGTGTYCSYP